MIVAYLHMAVQRRLYSYIQSVPVSINIQLYFYSLIGGELFEWPG